MAPNEVGCGSVNLASRFFRRTSAGRRPISAANRSMARSMAAVASGRPAPRYAPTGVVLVTTESATASARPIAYGPGAIRMVSMGRNAPNRG